MSQYKVLKVLIYDNENMQYMVGYARSFTFDYDNLEIVDSDGMKRHCPISTRLDLIINESKRLNNIDLDPTTMKRIAKFNKEQEIRRLDEVIKEKKEKIKELDDILQDKDQRLDRLKEFVANIYDLSINNEDDEYDYD